MYKNVQSTLAIGIVGLLLCELPQHCLEFVDSRARIAVDEPSALHQRVQLERYSLGPCETLAVLDDANGDLDRRQVRVRHFAVGKDFKQQHGERPHIALDAVRLFG